MKKVITGFTAAIALLATSFAYANEAKRLDDSVAWKEVVKINFKIGKRADAIKIITEHFRPASIKAKTPQPESMLEMYTGDFDLLVVWHMEGGVSDLTWDTSPDNIAWRKAFDELAGGKEEADKILAEYRSYIESAENDIAIVKS